MPSPEKPSSEPVTRHEALASRLLVCIADGTYVLGDRLPTEGELCENYGLSRGTVRQALDTLRNLGMVERHPGIGTTVVATHPVGTYRPFVSSAADISDLVDTTRLTNPQMLDVVLDDSLALRMGAKPGSRWHLLQGVRVRRDNPEPPLCWSEHYTPGDRRPEQIKAPLNVDVLTRYRMEQRVRAALLTEGQAKVLGAIPGDPALVVTRRIATQKGRLVNVGIYTHPADRYEIVMAVSSEHSQREPPAAV